jgi:hypothetical protein
MFKLQLCNVYTQEVIREVEFGTVEPILETINGAKAVVGKETGFIIIDSNLKTLEAEYVTHTMLHESKISIYKIFFKVKKHQLQPLLSKS